MVKQIVQSRTDIIPEDTELDKKLLKKMEKKKDRMPTSFSQKY